MLQKKIQRLQMETAIHETSEDPERDPTLKLREDLFSDEMMPELHMILRGSKLTEPLKKGAVLIQFPYEPIGATKEEIFEYEDYVMNSQEKFGKEIELETAQAPPTDGDDDEYMVTQKL